jgi:hypothetical protein
VANPSKSGVLCFKWYPTVLRICDIIEHANLNSRLAALWMLIFKLPHKKATRTFRMAFSEL